jgi:serine phosphatase RsbU (regulator of sigma subunit)
MEIVRDARTQSAAEIVDRVSQAIESHRAGFPSNDDTTMIALRITE